MTAADVSSHDDSIPKIISAIVFLFFSFAGHIICFAYQGAKIRILSEIFINFASWTNKTEKLSKRHSK
jgi:hypothetical protein